MKKTMRARLFMASLFVMMCFPGETFTQTFQLDAQMRPRFEVRDGYRRPLSADESPAVFVSQRTRLGITYQSDRLKLRIVPKDVRVWGDEEIANMTGSFGDHASVDLHEAYADLRLSPGLWLAVGRQEISYDNQSLLSNRNWNQHGIASDAVVLRYQRRGMKLHTGGTWNSTGERFSNNRYPTHKLKTMGFVWYNRPWLKGKGQLSAIHIATGVTESDTSNTIRFRQTTGLYADYKSNYTHVSGNIYYQYGLNRKGVPVSAWLADAEVSRRFGILTPGLGMGYLSGNHESPLDMKTDRSFYDIHRAKHRYFGFMDFFVDVPGETNHGGLINFYGYLDFKLRRDISLRNTVHYFSLAQNNLLTPHGYFLGLENDLVLRYRFSTWGVVEVGHLFFLRTPTLEKLQGVTAERFPQFFYTMLTLTPRLFPH